MGGPVPNSAVGPGLGAFLAFFALAVALYLLMRNMNGRMRRMAYRERDRLAALEASEAAKSGTAEGGSADGGPSPEGDACTVTPSEGADPPPSPDQP